MKNTLHSRLGFILIELLVVVLIIGILAGIALPNYQRAVLKDRFSLIVQMAHDLYRGEKLYFLANGSYTKELAQLDITYKHTSHLASNVAYLPKNIGGDCMLEGARVLCEYQNAVVGNFAKVTYSVYYGGDKDGKRLCCAYDRNNFREEWLCASLFPKGTAWAESCNGSCYCWKDQ